MGVISVLSSLAFVLLTFNDWSVLVPGCVEYREKVEEWEALNNPAVEMPIDTNVPRCNEYYYSRMPMLYEYVDLSCGLIYLVFYFLNLFISQNRCQFFISNSSIMELIIILPALIYPYDCNEIGLFMKAVSRMTRIYKVEIFLKSESSGEESNVSEKIKRIAMELVILLYISSVLFMVLENFNYENLDSPYQIQLTFYYMVVTLMTIGYGDYYPVTDQGKMFIIFMILYVIVYKIPLYT